MKAWVVAGMLAAGPMMGPMKAATQGPCPVVPNVPTVDLGHYRGAYRVLEGDGTPLGGWQVCPVPSGTGRPNAWETCSFSLCGLSDGAYAVRFSPVKGAKALNLNVQRGMLALPTTDLGVQNGNYGLDASGAAVPVVIDVAGYAGDWWISEWPGPFHGMDTGQRAEVVGGKLKFMLFPGVTYQLRFGDAVGTLTPAADGGLVASEGGVVAVFGGVARFRGVAKAP